MFHAFFLVALFIFALTSATAPQSTGINEILLYLVSSLMHILSGFPCRCCECGCILSHWYYERDGQLFCKKHYWARYGEQCHGCKEAITTGLVMVTLSSFSVTYRVPRNLTFHKYLTPFPGR